MKIPKLEQLGGVPQAPDMRAGHWALQEAAEGMSHIGQGLGRGLGGIARTIAEVHEVKKKISQATQLGEMRVAVEGEYINAKREFDQSNPNIDTYYQEASKIFDKSVEKILKQGKDTEVNTKFKLLMMEHKVTVLDSIAKEANQKWLDSNIASKMGQVDMLVDLAGKADDPEYAASYKESARAVIRSMSGNLIHQTKALELEKAKMQELDEAGVKNHILTDPVGAAKALAVGDYPDLSPKDRPYYKAQAKTAIKVMENDNEDKQVDLVVRGLKKEFGSDYAAIEGRLDDFDYMEKKFGKTVNTKIIAKAREDMRSRQISDDKIVIAKSKTVLKDTWLNLDKISISEIKRRVKEDGLDVAHGDALIKEKLNPPDIPSNPAEYNRVLDIMYDDTISVKEKANTVLSARIPRHEKTNLLGVAHRDENKADDHITKTGLDIIKSELGPKTNLMGVKLPVSEEEERAFYYANITFEESILNAKRNKKPLTSREAVDKAMEISRDAKISLTQSLKNRANALMGRGKELTKKTKKVEPKKPGETVDEYMKRVHPIMGIGPM